MIRRRVLFVCTGNICRSPTAVGVAREIAKRQNLSHKFDFDSAGIQAFHVGEPPDPRSLAAAAKRGYDLSALRARRVIDFDFIAFDFVLAMDHGHLDSLRKACPEQYRHKLGLFMEYAEEHEDDEVPDPYYGGPQGFDQVLDMIEDAAQSLVKRLIQK